MMKPYLDKCYLDIECEGLFENIHIQLNVEEFMIISNVQLGSFGLM